MKIKLISLEKLSQEETFFVIGGQVKPKKKKRKERKEERKKKRAARKAAKTVTSDTTDTLKNDNFKV